MHAANPVPDGCDWLDFSCSAHRAGGKVEFIAKVMLLKGWLKVGAGDDSGSGTSLGLALSGQGP